MTAHYLGDPKFRAFDANGDPLAGGKLYTYEPGVTAIPKTAYADPDETTPLANPVILDGNGQAEVWLVGRYYLVLVDADDNEQWTMDQVHGVGFVDATAAADEWVEREETPTHINDTQFSVPGDLRTTHHVGRRVRATVAGGTRYGTITASTFGASVTTVTLAIDGGLTLDAGLSAIAVGFLSAQNSSIPGVEVDEDDWTFQGTVTMEDTLDVTGAVTMASTLDVTGRLTAPGVVEPGTYVYSVLPSMSGFLLSYGQTLGSAASGADEADDDYELAFINLWNNLDDTRAPVSGGRGASAAADWAANKTIGTLDGRGVKIIGLDDMGGTPRNVNTDAAADIPGAFGGSEDNSLVGANIPPHVHSMAHTHGPGSFAVPSAASASGGTASYAGTGAQQPANQPVTGTSGGSSAPNTGSTGSGTAFSIQDPYIALNLLLRV